MSNQTADGQSPEPSLDMLRLVHTRLLSVASDAAPMIAWAIQEIEDHESSFDLRWDADMRAIARWREAHTGKEMVWPDHADLCVWLLEKLYGVQTDDGECIVAMSHALEVLRIKEPDGCRCGAFMRPIMEQLERAIADHRADRDPPASSPEPGVVLAEDERMALVRWRRHRAFRCAEQGYSEGEQRNLARAAELVLPSWQCRLGPTCQRPETGRTASGECKGCSPLPLPKEVTR